MRDLISEIQHENISLIAHSLGAQVLANCFFNANENKAEKSWLEKPTPAQKNINLCLVAPTFSEKIFDQFLNRTTNFEFKKQDNYRVFILYNEKDVVLKKR